MTWFANIKDPDDNLIEPVTGTPVSWMNGTVRNEAENESIS